MNQSMASDQYYAQFFTLGCKLNYSETATYSRALEALGFRVTRSIAQAHLIVVNSCGVTLQAQRKCRQLLHRLRRENATARIVVVGCYADLDAVGELRANGADRVVPQSQKAELVNLIASDFGITLVSTACGGGQFGCQRNYFPAHSVGGRTRSFLKVQDGCSYHCTYCAIPLARGDSRSPSLETIVAQANLIARAGAQEIVITGVNTGDFGRGTSHDFADLLEALAERTPIPRYRISSIEPNLLNERVLRVMAQHPCFMPHLHVPLQSGSDTVLRAMGRRYRAQAYRNCILRARERLGNIFIGVDVIVGFPGESDRYFEETEALLRDLRPSALHVFPFSAHPGTKALSLPEHQSAEVKETRVHRLLTLSAELESSYREQFMGQTRMLLVERCWPDGSAEGFTDNYLRIKFSAPEAHRGDIIPVAVR